jgi:hypothetical protein
MLTTGRFLVGEQTHRISGGINSFAVDSVTQKLRKPLRNRLLQALGFSGRVSMVIVGHLKKVSLKLEQSIAQPYARP